MITRATEPAIQVHYRASKVKQYLKEGRALRTETTVNDTYDFGIGRLLTTENREALVRVGHDIKWAPARRAASGVRLRARRRDAPTRRAAVHPRRPARPRAAIRRPARDGATRLALRLRPPTLEGLTNRSLRTLVGGLLPGYTARQMTYDLRRLRRKRLIERLPGTQRYTLTPDGRRLAVFFTKTDTRIVSPSFAELDPQLPATTAHRTPLGPPWREFERALDARIADAAITA